MGKALPADAEAPEAPAAREAIATSAQPEIPGTAPTPSDASSSADAADHPVILWDEVAAPETSEAKPISKDLPDDPSLH